MINNILVPLDGSGLAECALPYAGELAEKLGSGVTLITVTNRLQGFWPYEDHGERTGEPLRTGLTREVTMMPVGQCSMEDHAAKYLEEAAKKLETRGIKVRKEVVCGKTAEEIIIFANTENCDLIIMSSHGRSGPSTLVRGSVAQKVLKGARIPVMIVRPMGCGV